MTPSTVAASEISTPLLELQNISKAFSGTPVLDRVELAIGRGEVMGLVGENGAGKSTLMRIVTGIYLPDSGSMRFEGRELRFTNTRQSIAAGIAMIHQDLNLLRGMTVAENLLLGREPLNPMRFIDKPKMRALATQFLSTVQQNIDPHQRVEDLSVGQQQMVEIARALSLDARLIIMDEPTDALTDVERDILFTAIRRLRDQKKAVVYISHRLGEIFEICDSVTVLRDGRRVFAGSTQGLSERTLVHHMVGREITDQYPYVPKASAPVAMRIEHLYAPGIEDVSFEIHAGEVVGLAGLMGAGRSELARALYGVYPNRRTAKFELHGAALSARSPRKALREGIGYLPKDRKSEALIQMHSVRHNMSLAALWRFSKKLGFIAHRSEAQAVVRYTEALSIKTPNMDAAVSTLSGGNQQKVALAKALMTEPRVLILDEPTRGVDVGVRREIYKLINELKANGMAIMFISSDMPELLGIADRILVLSHGRLTGTFDHGQATQEAVMERALA